MAPPRKKREVKKENANSKTNARNKLPRRAKNKTEADSEEDAPLSNAQKKVEAKPVPKKRKGSTEDDHDKESKRQKMGNIPLLVFFLTYYYITESEKVIDEEKKEGDQKNEEEEDEGENEEEMEEEVDEEESEEEMEEEDDEEESEEEDEEEMEEEDDEEESEEEMEEEDDEEEDAEDDEEDGEGEDAEDVEEDDEKDDCKMGRKKWNKFHHKGPEFAPAYERLPKSVVFRYNGKPMRLSQRTEEYAGFYACFIKREYTTKELSNINTNFFKGWREKMTDEEWETITDLRKCDFSKISDYYKKISEEKKQMSKEEKLVIKNINAKKQEEFGFCLVDGHKEKVGNFKIEPPGLFRGRGDHPKMGMLKKRVRPEDVIINCSKDKIPQAPKGHKWKEVRHDNTVTWLASWTDDITNQTKYIMLSQTSTLKCEKDRSKYEKARELAKNIKEIRNIYKNELKSKDINVIQRALAMYFIDEHSLRAGNEKDEDQADTVGCCSLRYEHIKLHDKKNGKTNYVLVLDFLGKDSIHYYKEVPVRKIVFESLESLMKNKKRGDRLFNNLNTTSLNKHLKGLMEGLTAKVFRTYNASHVFQEQLDNLTPSKGSVEEKIFAHGQANLAVAQLCNHKKTVSKTHEKAMENLESKIKAKKSEIKKVRKDLKNLRKGTKQYEKKKSQLEKSEDQLKCLENKKKAKEECKETALGTSKLNYIDPRITVAWCEKFGVPVERVYSKTLLDKFRWAIDEADLHFRFD